MGWLNINGNWIGRNRGGQSWSTYWKSQTDILLFFGQISNIRDGKLYNEMSGSSDFLTVTGSAGSYVFETPNTEAYKDADEDNLWHTDDTFNEVSEADLIGEDYTRTIVKYDDDSPNTLRAIMILKDGVTLSEDLVNRMHKDLRLWIFWSLTLNAYGCLKSNRPIVSTPLPLSAEVAQANQDKVVITFDQNLDDTSVPATTDFTLLGKTISNVAIVGSTVILTVTIVYEKDDTVTVDYIQPVLNPIRSFYGNINADSFSDFAVVNNIIYPYPLDDGNTVGFYMIGDGSSTYMTKNASDFVSNWKDLSGNSHDLLQATGTKQPLYQSAGILFDGVDNFLKTAAFTWNQPEMIYAVLKQITWNDRILWDGNSQDTMYLSQHTATPKVNIYAGSYLASDNANLAVGTFAVVRALYNGANSSLQINDTKATAGNVGALNAGGFTLANRGSVTNFYTNIQVKEIILRKTADDAATQQAIYNYLKAKYGL